jgi:hypothetical protein
MVIHGAGFLASARKLSGSVDGFVLLGMPKGMPKQEGMSLYERFAQT